MADDNYLLREGVLRLVDAEQDLSVVGVAGSYEELLDVVDAEEPDVVITDIRMPPTGTDEGIRAATRIRQSHPNTGVVVLSQFASPSYALALLEGGSDGRAYLLKDRVADADDLGRRRAHCGRRRVGHRSQGGRGTRWAPARVRPRPLLDRLTPREREILSEMAQGKSNAAIAATLILSERAVEKHIELDLLQVASHRGARGQSSRQGGAGAPLGGGELAPPRSG